MPDEVIVHILSCLPIRDAVRTVLLCRFGNLWTLLPILKFDFQQVLNNTVSHYEWSYDWKDDDFEQFNTFIRNVLMLHKRLSIDTFHLSIPPFTYIERKGVDNVQIWLRFALGRQAKEIKFNTVFGGPSLPNFRSQSLVRLELVGCRIDPQLQVNLGSLKKLSLESVTMCEDAFQQFISGCPSLQQICIVNFRIQKLSFSAPNVDKLSLVLEDDFVVENSMLLDIPNLKSLDLNMCPLPVIIDVSSVRDLHLKGFIHGSDDFDNVDDHNNMLKVFFAKFKDVEVFRLSDWASGQFLEAIQCFSLSQNRWKSVALELKGLGEDYLLAIYQLMKSLKHLEELIIYSTYWSCGASTALLPVEFSSPCVMPKLKSVTLHVYAKPCDLWLQLVQFVLRSAACLDKLIIVPSKSAFLYSKASFGMPPFELSSDCVMPKLKTVTLHGYVKPWNRQLLLVKFLLKAATILDKLVIVPTKHLLTRDEELEFIEYVLGFQRASTS